MFLLFKRLFALVILLPLILLTGCNSEGSFSEPSPTVLERIDIVASPVTTRGLSQLTLAAGNTQPFEAVGYYSDGSSRILEDLSVSDWHTSDQEVGFFDAPGILTGGDTPGLVTIHATKDGITSNAVDVNVTAAVIIDITVTPATVNVAKSQTEQLTATAIYSDSTSSDVSDSVTWTSDDVTTATVDADGLLTGVEVGTTTLTATKDGITSNTVAVNVTAAVITDITITPAAVGVAKGQTEQLTATAIYSDSTSSDVSDSVTWTSDDASTATVNSDGLLTGVKVGTTTLTATKDGITSNTVAVNVTPAVITDITVTPATVDVAKGQTEQLTATAIYSDSTSSDVSDSVTWTSDDASTAAVNSDGLLTGVEVGTTTLTATKDGITSNTVPVNVTVAVLTDVTVSPEAVGVVKGQAQQVVAIATYSDSTSSDVSNSVTWTSNDTSTATVDVDGLLTGIEVGTTTLTATKDGVTSDAVDANVCADLAGPCIDLLDAANDGKLFTNSPSVPYLDSIGGAANDIDTEDGTRGPAGDFYQFNWNYANELCTTYNSQNLGGRTNWRLTTKDELLVELYGVYGKMNNARGWPTYWDYRSLDPNGSDHYLVSLFHGMVFSSFPLFEAYTSCVSEP